VSVRCSNTVDWSVEGGRASGGSLRRGQLTFYRRGLLEILLERKGRAEEKSRPLRRANPVGKVFVNANGGLLRSDGLGNGEVWRDSKVRCRVCMLVKKDSPEGEAKRVAGAIRVWFLKIGTITIGVQGERLRELNDVQGDGEEPLILNSGEPGKHRLWGICSSTGLNRWIGNRAQ